MNKLHGSTGSSKSSKTPFLCAIDHFFNVKGKGCILTGTILSGRICPGDLIEIGSTRTAHKIKGIQIFHKNVKKAREGDWVGINISNSGGDSEIS